MVSLSDADARPIAKGRLGKHVQFGSRPRWWTTPNSARCAALRPDRKIERHDEAGPGNGEAGGQAGATPHGALAHALRHTYATLLVDAGASLPEVQALLGHKDMSNTQVYLKATGRGLEDAARAQGALVPRSHSVPAGRGLAQTPSAPARCRCAAAATALRYTAKQHENG